MREGRAIPHTDLNRGGSSPFCSSACLPFRLVLRRPDERRLIKASHIHTNLFNKGDTAHLRTHCGSFVITLSSFVESSSRHNHEIYPHRAFFIKEPLGCGESPSFVLFPAHGSSRLPALNGSNLQSSAYPQVLSSRCIPPHHLYTSAVSLVQA